MAWSPFSHLLRSSIRRKPVSSSRLSSLIVQARPSCFFHDCPYGNSPFSTSASPAVQSEGQSSRYPDVKSSLSARMSFVFDQIDALERENKEKDETLQRIRAWRESKQKNDEPVPDTNQSVPVSANLEETGKKENLFTKKEIELVHPWSEWVEFVEQLVRQNYFDHRRKDEDQIIRELGCDEVSYFADEGFDFTRDWTTVRTACLSFGRDRFDLLRSLSRKDIQILVGSGCPSTDSKVVFSSKVLRKHVHLDEGDVCSSCNLRSTCNRGFLLTRKEDEARTLDVIRVLLTFGFDPINGSVENKSLMKMKSVKTVVRKLLHEIVKLSSVPIDPNLPPPEIKRPPPKIKQPPPPPKKRVGRDDVEMKKGDWLCPKCDFMNFAKNVVCLQCDAKRPKRQLLPGEWECPECNFLNYRRNVVCFHCEHKSPPDDYTENRSLEKPNVYTRTRTGDASRIPGIVDSYNFDFDDDESDGAEVAAFEFADSPKMANEPLLDDRAGSGGFEGQSFEAERMPRQTFSERARYAEQGQMSESSTRVGFDDFDEEEEDDVNSYEIDTSNSTYSEPKTSLRTLSDYEEPSGSEDSDDSSMKIHSRPMRKRALPASDDDDLVFGSDEELPNRTSRRSTNLASSRGKSNIRGRGPYSRSFVSDDELGLNSDYDDDMGESYTHKWNEGRKSFSRKGPMRLSDSEDELSFGSESEDGDSSQFHKKSARNRAGSTTGSRGWSNSGGDMRSRSSVVRGKTRDTYPRHDRGGYSDGFPCKNNRGARGGTYDEQRMTGRGGGASGSFRPRQGGYGNRERGRSDEFGGRYNEQRMAGRHGSSSGSYRPGQGAGYGNRGSRGNGRSSEFGDKMWKGNGRSSEFGDRMRRGNGRSSEFGDRMGRGNGRSSEFGDRMGRGNGRSSEFGDRMGRGNANDRPRRRIIER
ncbi:hypothetical protein H6P81_015065 [Aristolochia fimbriata]|uniref:RanBP2-type domain-containing protein n=1 Tax=Aristolochia fimbriata TaxID=158543 RepID=A0AAV7E6H3_ARIFI|nr:hypothetical protein H6P81_015065 [Aristolochia fimbriata]